MKNFIVLLGYPISYLVAAVASIVAVRGIYHQDIYITVKQMGTSGHIATDFFSSALFIGDPLNPWGLKRLLGFVSVAFVGFFGAAIYHQIVTKFNK